MWLKNEINCLHLFTLKKYFYPLSTDNWHFFLFQISFSFMWYLRDRFWTQYSNSEFFNWRWLEGEENMRGIQGRDKINWKKSSGSCWKHILNNSKPAPPVWILRGQKGSLLGPPLHTCKNGDEVYEIRFAKLIPSSLVFNGWELFFLESIRLRLNPHMENNL